MANFKQRAKDAWSYVNVLMNYLSTAGGEKESIEISVSPLDFLLSIIGQTGNYDLVREWLAKYIVYGLPALEVAVKTVLITYMKDFISCSTDPMIPYYLRKQYHAGYSQENKERGVSIPISSIDLFGLLDVSPFTDEGLYKYFGCHYFTKERDPYTGQEITIPVPKMVYSLARAEDYNAYLWFVIHKGHFTNPAALTANDIRTGTYGRAVPVGSATEVTNTGLGPIAFTEPENLSKQVIAGNCFVITDSVGTVKGSTVMLCIETSFNEDNIPIYNLIVPASDDWNSVNWYVNKHDYFRGNLTELATPTMRQLDKECAICNLEYVRSYAEKGGSTGVGFLGSDEDHLLFTILPKPFVHYPLVVDFNQKPKTSRIKNIEISSPLPVRILFDSEGNPDPNGKYSLNEDILTITPSKGEDETTYNIVNPLGGSTTLHVWKDGSYKLDADKKDMFRFLSECYKGLTIYEFYYDYLMGMRIFDARVFSSALIDAVLNTTISFGVSLTLEEAIAQQKVTAIVERLISMTQTSEDCFFTFSNAKWEALREAAEKKRKHDMPFGVPNGNIANVSVEKIREILEEYDETGTSDGQVDVISRTFAQAGKQITDNFDEEDRMQIELDFITNVLRALTTQIVMTVLSPKVLMILQVNQVLAGDKHERVTLEALLRSLMNVIMQIINKIRDMLIEALFDLVKQILIPMIDKMAAEIIIEQAEYYRRLLRNLWDGCLSYNGGYDLMTTLDDVSYADIDQVPSEPENQNC